MTHGEIYKKAYELKVFQVWELIEELLKEWNFLGRNFIKERVTSWLALQVRHEAVVKVNSNPPIFAIKEFSENWKKYLRYKTCPVCGKEFLPKKSQTIYCSERCANRQYAKRKWQKVKPEGRRHRKWTQKELEILRETIRKKGRLSTQDIKRLAKTLGRSFKAIQHKYYEEMNERLRR